MELNNNQVINVYIFNLQYLEFLIFCKINKNGGKIYSIFEY